MKTRQLTRLIHLAAACALLSLAARGADLQGRLKFGTIVPRGVSYHIWFQEMGDRWKAALEGRYDFIIYPGGTIGDEPDMVRRMRAGTLDGALLSATGLSAIDPALGSLQFIPLLFQQWDEVDHVRERVSPLLVKRLADKGFVLLFWADGGWVRFFSTVPAATPDDFRKLKIFTWAASTHQAEIMKALGYRPVPLDTSNIKMGLESHLIEAAPVPPFIANAGQFYTSAKHMLDLKWAPIVGGAVMRKETWEKLPADKRASLLEAANLAGQRIRGQGRDEDQKSIAAMQRRGLAVHVPSAAEQAAWNQLKPDLHKRVRGTLVPPEIFDLVIANHSTLNTSATAR